MHMDGLAVDDGPPSSPGSRDWPFDEVNRDRPVMSPENKPFALSQEYHCVVCIAQPRRGFDQGIEYRLQVERGATDHLEHVGGGGLLLKRFGEIVGALVQLF